jgi:peptidoglycan/xylan/chitin deacetylase (PgdA/CDA1 family)
MRRSAIAACLSVMAAAVLVAIGPADPAAAATTPSRIIMVRGTTWLIRDSLSAGAATWTFDFGALGDIPISGDWNGDGVNTPGVVRGNTWLLRNSLSGGPADITFTYGLSSDTIVVGDWDGDGIDTPGVVRNATWLLRNSNSAGDPNVTFAYGAWNDIPMAGDWNGDGRDTPGVIRGATRYLRNSLSGGTADIVYTFGVPTDRFVVGDWDGDGITTTGTVSGGQWYIRNSNSAGHSDVSFRYGNGGDLPLSTTSAFLRERGAWPLTAARTGNHMTVLPTTDKVVALTFDAGGNNAGISAILSTLQAQGVAASFFMTGSFARTYPAEARAIGVRYPVGNHTDTHPDLTTQTDAQIQAQLTNAYNAIRTGTRYDPRPLFRFPYGAANAHVLSVVNAAGYTSVKWTVDTLGWQGTSGGQSVSTVVSRVVNALKPGEIVLMHCGSNPDDGTTLDADALPTIISELRSRGYSFVALVPYVQ